MSDHASGQRLSRRVFTLLIVLLVATVAPAGAATGGVNFTADAAPNPWITVDVTKDAHQMGTAVVTYEDDSGEQTDLPAIVNRSDDQPNPFSFTVSDINESDFGAFPHAKSDISSLDASEWTVGGANSSSGSVSDVETAPGVEAVRLQTDGSMASGDVVNYTFSNFSVTSDENKRFLQLGLDVATLDSGATVDVRVVDEDGDYKVAEINTSRLSGEDFITNATGEGIFYQRQLGKMDLVTVGDGSFDNIERIEFITADGDFDGSVMALNVEKMSTYKLGVEKVDTDDDDDLETRDITEIKEGGPISVHSLDSLGSDFDDATLHGLTMPVKFRASDLASGDVEAEYNETGDTYPGYHGTANIHYRLSLPDAYELSYANAELRDEQAVTSDRIVSIEYAEGVSEDTDFADIEDSTYTDKTDVYSGKDDEVTLDSTIQPGQGLVLHYLFKLTQSQWDALQQAVGAGGFQSDGSEGFFGGMINWLMAAFATIAAALGLRKRSSGV